MAKTIFINQLKAEDRVTEHFFVQAKSLRQTKADKKPYLDLELCDRTGQVSGKVWADAGAEELAKTFQRGDYIKIEAIVEEYQGKIQLNVKRLRKSQEDEICLEDFTPWTSYDTEEMLQELQGYAQQEVEDPFYRELLQRFFQDQDLMGKFKKAPAAKRIHHAYGGGLLEHTLSVLKLCRLLVSHYHPRLNKSLLITSAILHDIGKIEELSLSPIPDFTDEGSMLGHIYLGLRLVEQKIGEIEDFPPPLKMLLEHMLLSHHGQYQWHSPVLPQFPEAEALYRADEMDAKLFTFFSHLEEQKEPGNLWTPYVKELERYIYKGAAELLKNFQKMEEGDNG